MGVNMRESIPSQDDQTRILPEDPVIRPIGVPEAPDTTSTAHQRQHRVVKHGAPRFMVDFSDKQIDETDETGLQNILKVAENAHITSIDLDSEEKKQSNVRFCATMGPIATEKAPALKKS